MIVYPVENICPTLHSDALENCQHGEENVVEVCDAAVGAFPFAPALSPIPPAKAPVPGKCTRWRIIFQHEIWSTENSRRHWANISMTYGRAVLNLFLVKRAETCATKVTRLVHPADEKLQADDSVDDDDKHDQHTNVQKGDHGFHDGV